MQKIKPDQISVVIQGPLHRDKEEGICRCLASVRKVLPGAEIIVSTWDSEDVSGLGHDLIIVQSEDPGFFAEVEGRGYNLNRQLVSTRAGLERATRDYILKFRADFALTDDSFFQVHAAEEGAYVGQRLTVSNLFIRDPEQWAFLYHMSDLVMFGASSDIRDYWMQPNFTEAEVLHEGISAKLFTHMFYLVRQRKTPEQTLLLGWLAKHGVREDLAYIGEVRLAHIKLWSEVLYRNFMVIDWKNSGVLFPRRFSEDTEVLKTVLSPERFQSLGTKPFSSLRVLWAKYTAALSSKWVFLATVDKLAYHVHPALARWQREARHTLAKAIRSLSSRR